MWLFGEEINLPGFKKDIQGNLIFELTEEEEREVQKQFDLFKRPGEVFVVRKEVVDETNRGITAQALFHYATLQITLSGFDSNKNNSKEFIDKAIASIAKAYSFCPLPIFIYDLAYFMEMNGRAKEAKGVFKSFLDLQNNFKPSQMQAIFLNTMGRDIDEAIKDAKIKLSNYTE